MENDFIIDPVHLTADQVMTAVAWKIFHIPEDRKRLHHFFLARVADADTPAEKKVFEAFVELYSPA